MLIKREGPDLSDEELVKLNDVSTLIWNQFYRDRARQFGVKLGRLVNLKVNSVLDVGCRCGETLDGLKISGYIGRLCGVDIVPNYCKTAQTNGLDVLCANAEKLPFDDGEFELVVAHHLLEHVNSVEKVWKEMTRVASRMIMIVVPLQEYNEEDKQHRWFGKFLEDWLEVFKHDQWKLAMATVVKDDGTGRFVFELVKEGGQ